MKGLAELSWPNNPISLSDTTNSIHNSSVSQPQSPHGLFATLRTSGMPRAPTISDVPPHIHLTIVPSPSSSSASSPSNVLLILPGLGDDPSSLKPLAQKLKLPSTTILTLRAPSPMPFELGGYHWGDDINFSSSTGALDPDAGFEKSTALLKEVVDGVLVQKCGCKKREIHLLGLGQGGMAGLAFAAGDEGGLGGVISVGGALPTGVTAPTVKEVGREPKARTPVLLTGGERGTFVTKSGVERTKNAFEAVEYVKWAREGDGMARSREEMMPLMRFWGRTLRSGVPEGAVEVG